MTPQENLRRALLNDEFPDDAQEDRLFSPTGTDALRQNRNIALSAWMTQVSGQDINAGSPTWQQDKDALVQGFFKNPTASNVSDDEIHGLVRSHIQTTEEAATMAADGALIGEALPSVLSAVRGKRGASQLRPIFDRYEQDAMRRHTALSIKLAPYRNLVNQVSGELRKEMESEVPTTDKLESMAERLLSVNPEDRPLVLKAIGATGGKDAKERASYLSKLAGAMGRMAETMGGSVVSAMSQASMAETEASLIEAGQTEFAGRMAKESVRQRDFDLLTQQIRTVADQEIAPIKGDAWYSQLGIDVARMIPQSAVTIANPALGMAANWAYFENTIAGEAMLQDPKLTPQQARSIAGVSAPLNAAVETVTALIPFGRVKLPFVQKWLQATATSLPTTAARFGVRAAVGTAAEIGEEYIQAWTPLKAQELLGALQKDMPAVDWENRMPKFADIAAQTWGPALVFSLVGAGSVSISEVNSGRALANDVDLMVATGLAPSKAQSIATAAESNNWQQVDTLFREDFVKPEKATDTEKAEATQRFLAKIQAHQEVETINAKEAEKIGGVRIFRDDEGWNVELADGSIIKTDSADAARRYRDELYLTELDHEAESMIALSDDLVKAFPGTRLELREEVLEADSDGLTLRSLTTGKTTVIKDAKSLENLWREASAVGFQSGKRTAQAVLGDNFMEFGKSIARVFQRGRGSNDAPAAITAMHEVIEAAWKKGVMAGQWSVEGTRQIIATIVPTLEAGIANLGKETQSQELLWLENAKKAAAEGDEDLIREVFVEMAVRTWIGRDRDGNKTGLRPGTILRALDAAVLQEKSPENVTTYQRLRAWFKAVGAYLKGVVATAKIIRDAERNGTIDDFTGFLDKVLGIETATREENDVKDGVIDMAFSLAPELKDGSTFSLAPNIPDDERITPENKVAPSINGKPAADIFAEVKKRHGVTRSIYEAGYVLPDGTMLDFSGRADAGGFTQGADLIFRAQGRDYMKDQRGVDHREIEWQNMPDYTEQWEAMTAFLRLGAVRVDANSGMISMHSRAKITSAQAAALKSIVVAADGAYIDLEDDATNRASMQLDGGKWGKVNGLLTRWANGETPEFDGVTFSLSPQSGIDIVSDTLESWQDVFDKAAKRNPTRAMAIRDLAQQRINRLGEMWAADRWTAKGDKIRAVVEKRTKGGLDDEQAMREALALDQILEAEGMNSAAAMRSKDSKDYEAWQRFQESKALILSKGEFTEEEAEKLAGASSSAWRKTFVSSIREAVKKAKAEAAAWRQEADDMQADDWSPRESLVRDMRVLNVALSAFPPKVRAKVTGGSMVKLAGLATERARYKAIQKALEKAIVETEVFMRKEYSGMLIKTLDKAAPIGKPGEVKKSKFIVTVQDEIDAINEMVGMDHDDVATAIAAAEAAIITAQTPEDADAKLTELNLLELFGGILDIKNTSSQEMASALEYLENIISQGRDARKMIDEARRERVKEMVNNAKREAYKGDSGPETTQAARAAAAKKSGKAMLKKFFNELSGFDAVLRDAFGPKSKTATEFSERFTLNSNRFEDVQNERRKRFRDFARELYRTKLGAKINQKLITLERIENASGVTYLKNRTVKTHKFTEEEAARIVADPKAFGFTEKDAAAISEEIQAIQETGGRRKVFTYEQVENEGDRTEIPLSQMDALYLSMALRQPGILEQQQRYGYDQETVDQLEKFLTDDAKRWRSWMQMEYDAGYNSANEVYMRMFNTRMPKITFYAPLMKNHQGQQAVLDPLNTGISSNSANPGSIKTRKARTSSLRIESAFSVFWSHFNQMEYWNANAEYLRDVQSVMLNPEVREAVVSAHGEDGMATISAWVQLQMSRGVGKAAMALASNKMIRNIKSGISMKALALSYTTTLKTLPSALYSLGEIHMSKWPAALVSGMNHWNRLWKTNIIQRRLDIGGMPELRDLGSSALPMSWVNQGIRYGSYPTMYADGVFTTYSAAMAYGTSFDEAKRQGASDDMAHKYAEERTALIVSKTAQPENWTQKSLFENDASGAGVLWTMFMSDPRQKMALTGEVLNQWRKGTATREEAARKFLAYWVIPGVMFQLANAVGRSLFKGDDDEWEFVDFATAALVGQFQGLVLFGSAIEMIFSAAIAAAAEKITGEEVKRKPVWNSSKNPLDQAAQDLIKSGEKLFMEDGDPLEKSWEAAKSAGMAITPLYPAGAILSTGERVMKDTTNLFYGADEK